jgi:long-chain acyl-CoA synthetase
MPEISASDILKALPARISDIVKIWAERLPNHAALVEAAGTWTYRELASVVADTEAWLVDSGVRPGDRVMIASENCRAFVATLFATAGLDAWPVAVNPRLSPREFDQIRDHCGARRVIYMTSLSPHAKEHAKRHGAVIGQVLALGTIGFGPLNESVQPEPVDPDSAQRIAALIYTSGTSGLPKGVMLTHRNVLFAASGAAKIRSLTPNDRFYGALPMFHVVGFSAVLLSALLSGATLYLTPRFDPIAARAALENDRVTVLLGVPAMYSQMLQYAKLRGLKSLDLTALRIISCSGAPLHPTIKAEVEKLFGLVLHHSYGVTETSPNIAQTRAGSSHSDTSAGQLFPGVEVKLVGVDQETVAEGEVGELWVRGPNLMKGYYRSPEETAAAVDAEGWFNTRDLARFEGENLFIVGRTKELIIRFGFNVYPAEVEAVLSSHPAVLRSAVIGRTIEGDEEVVAFVQLDPFSKLTTNDLAEYAAQHLAPYKRPSRILFVPSMPLTPTGKVIKRDLAKMPQFANMR